MDGLTILLAKVAGYGVRTVQDRLPARVLAIIPRRAKKWAKGKVHAFVKSGKTQTIAELEDKLWAGFSRSGLIELQAAKANAALSEHDRSEASDSLARWYATQGDFASALSEMQLRRAINPASSGQKGHYLLETLLLCRVGRGHEARALLESNRRDFDACAELAFANTWNVAAIGEVVPEAEDNILRHINGVYGHFGLCGIKKRDSNAPLSIDNICGSASADFVSSDRKVTVIVPVFNSESTVLTALRGLQEQSWGNLEVLVVDDVSSDNTIDIVADFCASDTRFRLIRSERNGGAYRARMRGLSEVSGQFVTIHDADDWSHPEKIGRQMQALRTDEYDFNISDWVRASNELLFRGNTRMSDRMVHVNHSSALFPTRMVVELGGWDHRVRVSADTEFLWRVGRLVSDKRLGFRGRRVLEGCPLSFGRDSGNSLTRVSATHSLTIWHGVRREYREAADFWHRNEMRSGSGRGLDIGKATFPVPRIISSERGPSAVLDHLFIADFNSRGEAWRFALEKMRAVSHAGLKCGLFHYPHYEGEVSAPLGDSVRQFAIETDCRIVAAGEEADARTVVVVEPSVFQHPMDRFPVIKCDRLVVVNGKANTGREKYDPAVARKNLIEFFGREGDWVQDFEPIPQSTGA